MNAKEIEKTKVIHFADFSFNYPDSDKSLTATGPLSLYKGEFLLISGASGSGKSTLLSIIKGLIPHYIHGTCHGVYDVPSQDSVYIFQNPYSQLVASTVKEEFVFALENRAFSDNEIQDKIDLYALPFGLNRYWERKTATLSGGECQRLILASALATSPKVILLDEPCAFLDPDARTLFYQDLKKLKNEGQYTVVIVDHHEEDVRPLVDRVWSIDSQGRVAERFDKKVDTDLDTDLDRVFDVEEMLPIAIRPLSHQLEIETRKLCFSYRNDHSKNGQLLLKNISLKVGSGEIVVITGENGQGKTTLLKILAGMELKSASVTIRFEGREIKKQKERDSLIGMIFQNPETHFCFDTVQEEILFNLQSTISKQIVTIPDAIASWLQFTKKQMMSSPYQLSEGEKRRFTIILSLIQQKDIIFYDEPTFGQDHRNYLQIKNLILQLKKLNKIQIIVTHNMGLAKAVGDRCYQLQDGELVSQAFVNNNE